MRSIVSKRDPTTGKDIPACGLCGWTISRVPRGEATEAQMEKDAESWADHLIDRHPDLAKALLRGKKSS